MLPYFNIPLFGSTGLFTLNNYEKENDSQYE